MHPLDHSLFGEDGLHCVFAKDQDGNTAVGTIVRQVGTSRFVVTDGSVTKTCTLAKTSDDVASLSNMPPGMMTFLLSFHDGTQHIRYLTARRCVTVEGNNLPWHLSEATETIGQIITPSLSVMTMQTLSGIDADFAIAYDVKPDGSLAVGVTNTASAYSAFFWVPEGGMTTLPGLPECGDYAATALSTDGTIAGWCNASDGHRHLIRWGDGLDDLGYQDNGGSPITTGLTTDVFMAEDASAIAFSSGTDFSIVVPCLWTVADGISILPMPGEVNTVQVGGISADGNTVVGYCNPGGVPNLYFWHTPAASPEILNLGNIGGEFLIGTGVSNDASVVCGYYGNGGTNPFYYRGGQFTPLGGLSEAASRATCISSDGTIIGGWATDSESTIWAVRWVWNGEGYDIEKLDPSDAITSQVYGMSGTGSAFAGSAIVGSSSDAVIWT